MLPLDLPTGQDGATGHACRHASRSDALRECSLSLCRLSAVNSSKFVVPMLFPVVLRSCRKKIAKIFAMCSEILRLESDKESCVPPRDAIQNVYSHCVGCRRPITIQFEYLCYFVGCFGHTVKICRKYTQFVPRYCVLGNNMSM